MRTRVAVLSFLVGCVLGLVFSLEKVHASGFSGGGGGVALPVTATNGGTGQSSFTTGDILYASNSTTISKLAAGNSTYVLTSNGAGVAPSWQAAGGSLSGITNSTTGQLSWSTGSGGINHIVGPSDTNYFTIKGSDSSGGTDGRGIKLQGGSGTNGTGYGGGLSVTMGDAGSTGSGQGGSLVYSGGRGYGTNTSGGNSNWNGSRGTGTGEVGGFNYRIYGKQASGTSVHSSIDHQFTIARNLTTSGMALILGEINANASSTDVSDAAAIAIYTKSDKLVFAYNAGGTMTYISIPLDGSTTTWTHSTSAP